MISFCSVAGPQCDSYVLSGRTGMSDASQVVEDVVERWVGFLTCLAEQQWDPVSTALTLRCRSFK